MWHASVSTSGQAHYRALERAARSALRGVGDATAGEWVTRTEDNKGKRFVHLRRRLTGPEARIAGDVRDVRGTAEASIIARRVSLATGIPTGTLLKMG